MAPKFISIKPRKLFPGLWQFYCFF